MDAHASGCIDCFENGLETESHFDSIVWCVCVWFGSARSGPVRWIVEHHHAPCRALYKLSVRPTRKRVEETEVHGNWNQAFCSCNTPIWITRFFWPTMSCRIRRSIRGELFQTFPAMFGSRDCLSCRVRKGRLVGGRTPENRPFLVEKQTTTTSGRFLPCCSKTNTPPWCVLTCLIPDCVLQQDAAIHDVYQPEVVGPQGCVPPTVEEQECGCWR